MSMHVNQRTLRSSISCSGRGVHSGKEVKLTIKPAPLNHGIKFKRTDLPDCPAISAHMNMVVDTSLATVIGYNGFIVSTIEHLMAAFSGLSIDNALVEIDSHEVPIMDGSAWPFTSMIQDAGIREQGGPRCFFVVREPIRFGDKDKSVSVYPSPDRRITCTIEFDHPLLKKQTYSVKLTEENFVREISRARTFGFLHEIDYLKKYGFARGGSLDNVVVLGTEGVINDDGLRFQDEFVRHKILDCIGDFSLLGMPILGHIVLRKTGHAFNHAFLKEFLKRKSSWKTLTIENAEEVSPFSAAAMAM